MGGASSQKPQLNAQTYTSSSQKWEYASFLQLYGSPVGLYKVSLPDKVFGGNSIGELFQEILGRPAKPSEYESYVIMNWLGEHGWELVDIQTENASLTFWFKRQSK